MKGKRKRVREKKERDEKREKVKFSPVFKNETEKCLCGGLYFIGSGGFEISDDPSIQIQKGSYDL